ncbi:MAG: glycosyltransferase family 2 protein, partial [Dehalococcoidia bacterium]|nr:glycosyltransferase family 2 protein [Dehalococcoidia bacterium]
DLLKDLCQNDDRVKVVRLTRNFGQHAAVLAGFNVARGSVIITIDADLQNPPEEIPRLLNKMDEGYEVVFGIFKREHEPFYRRIGSAFTKWVLSRLLPSLPTNLSGFRILRSFVVDELKALGERSMFIDGPLCWMGFKIATVDVKRDKRLAGKSKYNLFKLINYWLDLVISLTNLPLKIAMLSGIILGLVGLLLAFIYLVGYLLKGYPVQGFATTVIFITVFSGVQLFCLGIIGEYIGRINLEVRNKPKYIVRELLNIHYTNHVK